MSNDGRYIRYREKAQPCGRCGVRHGVLAMRFDMSRAVEDAALKLRDQIDADLIAMLAAKQ